MYARGVARGVLGCLCTPVVCLFLSKHPTAGDENMTIWRVPSLPPPSAPPLYAYDQNGERTLLISLKSSGEYLPH